MFFSAKAVHTFYIFTKVLRHQHVVTEAGVAIVSYPGQWSALSSRVLRTVWNLLLTTFSDSGISIPPPDTLSSLPRSMIFSQSRLTGRDVLTHPPSFCRCDSFCPSECHALTTGREDTNRCTSNYQDAYGNDENRKTTSVGRKLCSDSCFCHSLSCCTRMHFPLQRPPASPTNQLAKRPRP